LKNTGRKHGTRLGGVHMQTCTCSTRAWRAKAMYASIAVDFNPTSAGVCNHGVSPERRGGLPDGSGMPSPEVAVSVVAKRVGGMELLPSDIEHGSDIAGSLLRRGRSGNTHLSSAPSNVYELIALRRARRLQAHSTAQHCTAPHSTAQHRTAPHRTATRRQPALHSSAPHSRAQHSS
jgi:hypothetical protein